LRGQIFNSEIEKENKVENIVNFDSNEITFENPCTFHPKQDTKVSMYLSIITFFKNFENMLSQNNEKNYFRRYFMDINFNVFKFLNLHDLLQNDYKRIKSYVTNVPLNRITESSEVFQFLISCFYIALLNENSRFVMPYKLLRDKFDIVYTKTRDDSQFLNLASIIISYFIKFKYLGDENNDPNEKTKALSFNEIKEFFFFIFFIFETKVKTFFNEKRILFKMITIFNMTIFQRQYYLIDCVKNEELKYKNGRNIMKSLRKFGKIFLLLVNALDFLLKHYISSTHKSTSKFKIPEETIYFFIKIVKFLTKYNLFPYLNKSDPNGEDLKFNCFNLINEIALNNINRNQEGRLSPDDYIKLPSLKYLFDIVALTLTYHNDSLALEYFNTNSYDSEDTKFAYTFDHSNRVISEAVRLFDHAISLRNLCKKIEMVYPNQDFDIELLSIDNLFYDMKFITNSTNSPCTSQFYESMAIDLAIKKIFSLLIGNNTRGNKLF